MIYTLIRKDYGGDVDSIISFDSITSMDESWSATVATQTVEKGFNITDNVNIEPEVYSIEAIISSYSLFIKDKEITWDGSRFNSKNKTDDESHIKARAELIRIFKEGSVLTLLESTANSNSDILDDQYKELKAGYFNEIEDCVITNMGISHPSAGTGAFVVSLKIQKIHVATVEVQNLPEGESLPLLTPMQAKEAPVSSSTKKDGDVTEAGSEVALEPEDGVKKPTASGGLDWYDEYNGLQRELAKMRNIQQSIAKIREYGARTNSLCTLEPNGNGAFKANCVRG